MNYRDLFELIVRDKHEIVLALSLFIGASIPWWSPRAAQRREADATLKWGYRWARRFSLRGICSDGIRLLREAWFVIPVLISFDSLPTLYFDTYGEFKHGRLINLEQSLWCASLLGYGVIITLLLSVKRNALIRFKAMSIAFLSFNLWLIIGFAHEQMSVLNDVSNGYGVRRLSTLRDWAVTGGSFSEISSLYGMIWLILLSVVARQVYRLKSLTHLMYLMVICALIALMDLERRRHVESYASRYPIVGAELLASQFSMVEPKLSQAQRRILRASSPQCLLNTRQSDRTLQSGFLNPDISQCECHPLPDPLCTLRSLSEDHMSCLTPLETTLIYDPHQALDELLSRYVSACDHTFLKLPIWSDGTTTYALLLNLIPVEMTRELAHHSADAPLVVSIKEGSDELMRYHPETRQYSPLSTSQREMLSAWSTIMRNIDGREVHIKVTRALVSVQKRWDAQDLLRACAQLSAGHCSIIAKR